MPNVKYKTVINASFEHVCALLQDKVEKPKKYVGAVLYSAILERGEGYVIRQMYAPKPVELTIKEKIYFRDLANGKEFIFENIDNADYVGVFRNTLTRIEGRVDQVELEYHMDWTPHPGTVDKMSDEAAHRMVDNGVIHMKTLAENPVIVPEWLRVYFDVLDSLDADAITPLLAENCKLRMGNETEILGRAGVVEAYRRSAKTLSRMKHECVGLYADKGRTFVEHYVEYTMPNGADYLLPFLTVFERVGDKVSDVKVYGDTSPLLNGWPGVAA